MADFRPTASQQAAIDARGGAVLVSAGAGSGKTRVLTERLMGYICDDAHPVTYFSEGEGRFLKDYVCEETQDRLTPQQWQDLVHFEGNSNAFRLLTHHFKGRREEIGRASCRERV